MNIRLYQIDAFTNRAFSGNPAAICPLGDWLPDALMLKIAAENNLSETAFFVQQSAGVYQLRWFTPTVEVELCGHATLATAWVLWNKLGVTEPSLSFITRSGKLLATHQSAHPAGEEASETSALVQLDFPARPSESCETDPRLEQALGVKIVASLHGANRIAVLESAAAVSGVKPNFALLASLPYGVIITAADESGRADFVSRYFAVPFGVDEDPVTGSTHCDLMPYWTRQLGRQRLNARQVSARGGELFCEQQGDRVLLSGHAVCVLSGELHLPASV